MSFDSSGIQVFGIFSIFPGQLKLAKLEFAKGSIGVENGNLGIDPDGLGVAVHGLCPPRVLVVNIALFFELLPLGLFLAGVIQIPELFFNVGEAENCGDLVQAFHVLLELSQIPVLQKIRLK